MMEIRGRGVQTLREGKEEAGTGSQGIGKGFLGERRVGREHSGKR